MIDTISKVNSVVGSKIDVSTTSQLTECATYSAATRVPPLTGVAHDAYRLHERANRVRACALSHPASADGMGGNSHGSTSERSLQRPISDDIYENTATRIFLEPAVGVRKVVFNDL